MTVKEILNLTSAAFESGSVRELLLGEGDWIVPVSWKDTANTPTDWDRLIYFGVHLHCKADDTDKRIALFEDAYMSLLSGDAASVCAAFDLYFSYWYRISDNLESNLLFSETLKEKLARAINLHKADLAAIKEWCGHTNQSGMYENISRLDSTLAEKFGAGVL